MKKSILFFAGFLILFCIVSCKPTDVSSSEDYMIFDEVKYVEDFPITTTLSDAEDTGFDIIGLNNFHIIDSVLFVSAKEREGFWQFYSMKNKQLMGKMLTTGQGPNEFFFPIYDDNTFSIECNEDKLYAMIFDNQHGCVYKLDIYSTLKGEDLDISVIFKELSNSVFWCKTIDEQTFFCRQLSNGAKRQLRYVQKDGEKEVPEVLEKLNQAMVSDVSNGIDQNIISSMIQKQGNRFLESMPYLNYINIYSLDGKLCKTICIGDELYSISSVQAKADALRKNVFTSERVFDKFFGVAFYDHTWMEWELGTANSSQIQLFNWEGRPLVAINIDRIASAFDIDFKEGYLYVLSARTDEFVKYDISDLLKQLNH